MALTQHDALAIRRLPSREENVKRVRVLSNVAWLGGRSSNDLLEVHPLGGSSAADLVRDLWRARRYSGVFLNIDSRRLLLFAVLKMIPGFRHLRLVSLDIHLSPPRRLVERLLVRFRGAVLRHVDLFLVYYTSFGELCRIYGLNPERFTYVPFKVNDAPRVAAASVRDDGFLLVCGRSERDYATLERAASGSDVPIVVLEYAGSDRKRHGAALNETRAKSWARVVQHDGDPDTWIDWMARARAVVIPIVEDSIKPSGISTYLVAMALGKCVVISDSPSTCGLIDSGQAVVVPASDPEALRSAMQAVWSDHAFREEVAREGQKYAIGLGTSQRLYDDIYEILERFFAASVSPPSDSRSLHSSDAGEVHAQASEV